jgi:hypothetical protein
VFDVRWCYDGPGALPCAGTRSLDTLQRAEAMAAEDTSDDASV